MTKPYVSDFNMISQHYNYKETTSDTIGIPAEDICLSTDYNQMPNVKGKTHHSGNHTGPGSPPESA